MSSTAKKAHSKDTPVLLINFTPKNRTDLEIIKTDSTPPSSRRRFSLKSDFGIDLTNILH